MGTKFVILPLVLVPVLLLSGCGNTIEGFGRDVTEWGQTLDDMF